MATLTDLTRDVLEELKVLAAGETPSADDLSLITRRYNQRIHGWTAENLIDHSGVIIPDKTMPGLTLLMADIVARSYSKRQDPARVAEGRRLLRLVNGIGYDGSRVRTKYY
jgi:hypothetical protein